MSSNMCLNWRCTYACSPEILNGISAVLPQSLRSLYTACSLCAWSKPGDRSSFNCSVVKGRLPREALPIVSQPLYPHTQTSTCAHVFGTMTKPFDMYCSLTPCSSIAKLKDASFPRVQIATSPAPLRWASNSLPQYPLVYAMNMKRTGRHVSKSYTNLSMYYGSLIRI